MIVYGQLEVVKFLITLYEQENNTQYLEILVQYPNLGLIL